MKKNEPVSNIMSNHVVSVQEGQSLSEVRHRMIESSIHHIPVLDGNRLVGMVSFTDMMKLNIVISGADDRTIDAIIDQQFRVSDVMSRELITLSARDPIREAADILCHNNFHAIPVVNGNGELEGIVTSSDLIRYLSEQY